MAIGTHEGIGDQFTVPFNDSFGKIFQIYLMANTHPRWHDPKIIKRFLCPLQELVAFYVPLVFLVHIAAIGIGRSKIINLYRMVDDKIYGNKWAYGIGIFPFTG